MLNLIRADLFKMRKSNSIKILFIKEYFVRFLQNSFVFPAIKEVLFLKSKFTQKSSSGPPPVHAHSKPFYEVNTKLD